MTVQQITVLGCTGSIGVNTLDVIARHPDRYRVFALCAHRQVDTLFAQCQQFAPRYAVVGNVALATQLHQKLQAAGIPTEVRSGPRSLIEMAAHPDVDIVMAAIVGAAGLEPALAAARQGKKILLANKESLVMAGHLFMQAVAEGGATLLPVDSEHNAIFQALPAHRPGQGTALTQGGVRRLLLTASGGPFRKTALADLQQVTPEMACAHPNWVMGQKISVDSASMMNKGLELIEAYWLFGLPTRQIEVVVHPQSIIHSMVEYVDGSILAQMGNPDMRTPIAHALAYPERIASGVAPLDLFQVARLDFEAPDPERFPCLHLAYQALERGGTAPAMLNAANEVAVEAFLQRRLPFMGISRLIAQVLEQLPQQAADTLSDVLEADRQARHQARNLLDGQSLQ